MEALSEGDDGLTIIVDQGFAYMERLEQHPALLTDYIPDLVRRSRRERR